MSFGQATELLMRAARAAGREPLMTDEVRRRIFERSQGHPYAMKLIASQVTSEQGLTSQMTQVVREGELLDALFRRSIQDLSHDEDAVFLFLLVAQFASGLSEPVIRTVTDSLEMSLDDALRELRRRSLVEMDRTGEHVRYDMPAMAREFALRHLSGHVLQTEIESWAQFLKRWPALLSGRLREGAEQILHSVHEGRLKGAEIDRALSALRSLAGFESEVWPIAARAERAAGKTESVWEDAYKRAVEHDPSRSDLLWEWSEVTPSTDRKIELKVQSVFADRSNVALASRTANFLNYLYADDRGRFSKLQWSALMTRVIEVLEQNFSELDGEALSRLAWLYIHANRSPEACRVIEQGLKIDYESDNLRKLATRLKIRY